LLGMEALLAMYLESLALKEGLYVLTECF
jgi:hypothetical protein